MSATITSYPKPLVRRPSKGTSLVRQPGSSYGNVPLLPDLTSSPENEPHSLIPYSHTDQNTLIRRRSQSRGLPSRKPSNASLAPEQRSLYTRPSQNPISRMPSRGPKPILKQTESRDHIPLIRPPSNSPTKSARFPADLPSPTSASASSSGSKFKEENKARQNEKKSAGISRGAKFKEGLFFAFVLLPLSCWYTRGGKRLGDMDDEEMETRIRSVPINGREEVTVRIGGRRTELS